MGRYFFLEAVSKVAYGECRCTMITLRSDSACEPTWQPVASTGASRGIGRGIALALAARGLAVVVNYRGNAEAAAETLHSRRSRLGGAAWWCRPMSPIACRAGLPGG